jgi:hypothetical protein
MKFFILTTLLACFSLQSLADKSSNNMNNQRLEQLIKRIDAKATGSAGNWTLKYEGYEARILTDEKADRMRIIVAVERADKLDKTQLYRLMQANFDTALDTRYSIAKGIIWSAFIHPLSSLTDNEFLSGMAQVINLTSSYGSSYSSGALRFSGGDSETRELNRYRELMNKGQRI